MLDSCVCVRCNFVRCVLVLFSSDFGLWQILSLYKLWVMFVLLFVQSCVIVLNDAVAKIKTPISRDNSNMYLACDGFVTYNRIVCSKFDTSAKAIHFHHPSTISWHHRYLLWLLCSMLHTSIAPQPTWKHQHCRVTKPNTQWFKSKHLHA